MEFKMLEKADKVVILITAASEEQARKLARLLLNQRKAACVNIVPKVESLYWWKGKLESAQEILLIVKTKASLVSDIVEAVKKAHSYEVSEIIALPIVDGNEDYLKWVEGEVREE